MHKYCSFFIGLSLSILNFIALPNYALAQAGRVITLDLTPSVTPCGYQPEMEFRFPQTEELNLNSIALAYDVIIEANGCIMEKTPEKFANFIQLNGLSVDPMDINLEKKAKNILINLTSNGGNLVAGLLLGHIIRSSQFDTKIQGVCASACTYTFAGGRFRYFEAGELLVHRFNAPAGQAISEEVSQTFSAALSSYLGSMGVSSDMLIEAAKYGDKPGNVNPALALKWSLANNGRGKVDVNVYLKYRKPTLSISRTGMVKKFRIYLVCERDGYSLIGVVQTENTASNTASNTNGYESKYKDYYLLYFDPKHSRFERKYLNYRGSFKAYSVTNDPDYNSNSLGNDNITWKFKLSNDQVGSFGLRYESLFFVADNGKSSESPVLIASFDLDGKAAEITNFHSECNMEWK